MISRYSKKYVQELVKLIKVYGYWSNEVLEFNNKFDHYLMKKINNEARIIIRYGNWRVLNALPFPLKCEFYKKLIINIK